jgi:hypothetical protein
MRGECLLIPNDVCLLTLAEYRAALRQHIEWAQQVNATAPLATTLEAVEKRLGEVDGVPTRLQADEWLTPKQVADILQIPVQRVHETARAHRWSWAKRVSPRKWRFSRQGLERFMNGRD